MACYQPDIPKTCPGDRPCKESRKLFEVTAVTNDRSELARLREKKRQQQQVDATKKAISRAKKREAGWRTLSLEVVDKAGVIEAVRQYARERSLEAVIADPIHTREPSTTPLMIEVVDVPVIKEMVRRYAEALNEAHRFYENDPTPYGGASICQDCGAPRMIDALRVSDRPY